MAIYIYFAMAVLKSSSVVYVGSMEMLTGLTREQASWPATLTLMLSQLAGPVYGIMVKFTSERICLVLGAILCSAPLIAAAHAHDILQLCILVGIVHGLGCACSEVIPFVVLMRHFQRYRGTVISAMYIITAVSGFLMPVFFEYVRQKWGFRICLLVMGCVNAGMFLGCVVVSRMPVIAPLSHAAQSSVSNGLPAPSTPKLLDISLSTDSFLVGSILINKSQQVFTLRGRRGSRTSNHSEMHEKLFTIIFTATLANPYKPVELSGRVL
ncbi:monocarboxylate transporter 14-like [Tropilaelaps mercedesae]|uniref:Monocarboxylate transporter 14-like n=1 Tax=Tropilaelaps mercedesae TaxID=418985 RepID=A0A1V9XJP0_9ACAR|nr:monocarboxylate transporter 14-like [Tropilaelaps mercedesae]